MTENLGDIIAAQIKLCDNTEKTRALYIKCIIVTVLKHIVKNTFLCL